MAPSILPTLLHPHESWRTSGTCPIPDHLRPAARLSMEWCPLFTRLETPTNRRDYRNYDVSDFLPFEEAFAVPIAGDA